MDEATTLAGDADNALRCLPSTSSTHPPTNAYQPLMLPATSSFYVHVRAGSEAVRPPQAATHLHAWGYRADDVPGVAGYRALLRQAHRPRASDESSTGRPKPSRAEDPLSSWTYPALNKGGSPISERE